MKTESEKRRISEILSTPEIQAKLSAAHKGRKQSPEHVAKRVAAQVGLKRTPEQREALRLAHLGKPWSAARRAAQAQRQMVTA